MKQTLLKTIRLSDYFKIFFLVFLVLTFIVPEQKFESAALTLFSVNSFLYGFYIAPILGAQKARIEDLHRIIRNEANAMFSLVLKLKKLPKKLRNELQALVSEYIVHTLHERRVAAGEDAYEKLITYCVTYKGEEKEQIDKVLDKLVENQQNRTMLNMQLQNRVYSNEWLIMGVLFSITLGFILLIEIGDSIVLHVIKALLCTGLSMLIVILVKLSTLSHKKADEMWKPLDKLLKSRYYRID